MALLGVVLGAWVLLSALGVLGAAAVCRAGHQEDVARGFIDLDAAAQVPAPRAQHPTEQAQQVTHR